MVRTYFMDFLLFKVPVNPVDSSHTVLCELSAQCFASGLHLCYLCSAKCLKMLG